MRFDETVSRTRVDEAGVSRLGNGLVLVVVSPDGGTESSYLAEEAEADAALASDDPYTALSGRAVRRFWPARPGWQCLLEDTPAVWPEGVGAYVETGDAAGYAESGQWDGTALHVDFENYALWAPGAARPLPTVRSVDHHTGVSARNYRLPGAEKVLSAHPWVVSCDYNIGIGGAYAHVPPGYDIAVRLPQAEHDAFHDWAAGEGRTSYSDHDLALALFADVRYAAEGVPAPDAPRRYQGFGPDPVGLAGCYDDSYEEPEDDSAAW